MNLLAPVRGWEARRALKAARRDADAELLASRLPSPRLAWRVEELLDEENRTNLGRAVTDVVHASDERMLPGATPLDRVGVRRCRPELLELASRLHDLGASVRPRGVLLVELLLDDSSSPLYQRGDQALLRRAINEARRALDGD